MTQPATPAPLRALPAAILWDLDGTLVDTEPLWIETEIELVTSYGGTWTHSDALSLVGNALEESARVLQGAGVTLGVEELIDTLVSRVNARVLQDGPIWRPGAFALVAEAAAAGVPQAIVTMSYRVQAEVVAAALPAGAIGAIVAGDMVTQGKPHPEAYLTAAALLGVDVADCVAVEDSATGTRAALASGAATVAVPYLVPVPELAGLARLETLDGVSLAGLVAAARAGAGSPARVRTSWDDSRRRARGGWVRAGRRVRTGRRGGSSVSTTAQRTPRWRLGSIRGVPVYLAPSWLVVAAILTIVFLPTVRSAAPGLSGPAAFAAATSFPILLFASVFAHELAHGSVATAFGVRVREYVLTFWGGHTSFGTDLRTPGVSAAVSAAGPLANLVLAGAGWLALHAMDRGLPAVIVASLVWANLVVAVFNLLPGNPLDGGRILEALIWKVTGSRDTGTLGAGWVGRVIAVAIVVLALGLPLLRGERPSLYSGIWALLVAGIVWSGASRSIAVGRARRSAVGFDLRPLLRPSVVLDVHASLADVPESPWGLRTDEIVVVDGVGRVVAVADRDAVASVPPAARPGTPLTAVARALPAHAVVTAVTGPDALAQVARGLGVSDTLVAVSEHGVLGTVDRAALVAALQPRSR